MIQELLALLVLAGVLITLYSEKINRSPWWPAAVTPLASIIGSGFLVSGPVLVSVFGYDAPAAMALVVCSAYLLGNVIRFNIRHAEPLLRADSGAALPIGLEVALFRRLKTLEILADISLGFAYIASVAFYIRLLAAFVLRILDVENAVYANILATILLAAIAGIGWFRNLRGLVFIEKHAVNGKLSIIACLLVVLAIHYFQTPGPLPPVMNAVLEPQSWSFENLRYLAGVLLIVQGFETSRYLGAHYTEAVRIKSMRIAQLLSAVIYCLFILWSWRLFVGMNGQASETDIIGVIGSLSVSLPYLLVLAAVLSQFSAAIADTLGAGGLQAQLSRSKITERQAYILVCGLAVGLIWTTDIFSIITIASRIFAVYYLFQTLIALLLDLTFRPPGVRLAFLSIAGHCLALGILLFVILFATPLAA